MATPRFEEIDGEIYDRTMGQIIPMDEFRRLSRGKAGDQFARDLASQGGLAETDADLQSSPDAATLAAVANPEADATPDEDVTPPTPQQDAARADARPVAASATPADQLPQPRSARPPLDEWMEVVGARNPGVSPRVLRREWAKQVGAGNFYDPKDLPTWEDYQKDVAPLNPGVSPKAIRNKWEEDFGDFGAQEKPTPDKPWHDDAKEVLRQIVGGAVVDLPRMTGQALQAFSPEGSAPTRYGKELVAAAKLREAGWRPDLEGRGTVADALIRGGRGIAPSIATVAAYLNPAGEVLGPIATVALFGGDQFQEEYDKVIAAGGTETDARNAGLITGALQGGGEVVANRLTLGVFGALKGSLAKAGIKGVVESAVDKSIIKPWAKATGQALVGEPATEVLQDVGTSITERQYGLETSPLLDTAKESGSAALGMTVLLSPFGIAGHYKNAQRAKSIDTLLADPNAGTPAERSVVVDMLHSEAAALKIPNADTWKKQALEDVKAGLPIRRDVAPERPPLMQDITAAPTIEDAAAAAGKFVDGAKTPKTSGSAAGPDFATGADMGGYTPSTTDILPKSPLGPLEAALRGDPLAYPEGSALDGMTPRRPIDLATQDQVRAAADLEAQEASLLDTRTPPAPLDAPPAPERTRTPYETPIINPATARGLLDSVPTPVQDELQVRAEGDGVNLAGFDEMNFGSPQKSRKPKLAPVTPDEDMTFGSPQGSVIAPGQAFTPRQPAAPTPQEVLAKEREQNVAEREAARLNPRPPAEPPAPVAPPSLADTVATKAAEAGISSPVLQAMIQQKFKKSTIEEMTPTELRVLSDRLDKLKQGTSATPAAPTVTPVAPAKPETPLAPEPLAEAPEIGPTNVVEEAQVPRNELPPEKNAELLARAEKAQADLDVAASEGLAQEGKPSLRDFLISKGGLQNQGKEVSTFDVDKDLKPFQKNLIRQGGLTLDRAAELAHDEGLITSRDRNTLLDAIEAETRGAGGTTAGWYAAATTGPGKLSRKRVEIAVEKIIADKGRDTGKDVQRVKELLMLDREFNRSPFAPKNAQDWDRMIKAALDEQGQQTLQPATPTSTPTNEKLVPKSKRGAAAPQGEQPQGKVFKKPHQWRRLGFNDRDKKLPPQYPNNEFYMEGYGPAPTAATQPATKPGQQEIAVPPETIGSRPIIGREVTPEEAPLFSKAAQEPDAEQTSFSEQRTAAPAPKSPTEIIADALRNAADQIAGTQAQGTAISGEDANLKTFPDPSPEEARAVQAGVEGKSALEVAQFIADNAPSKWMRLIAERVAARVKLMADNGYAFEFHVYHGEDKLKTAGNNWTQVKSLLRNNSRALATTHFKDNRTRIFVNGAERTGLVGTSYATILHELVHTVTHAATFYGAQFDRAGTALGKDVAALRAVKRAIKDHLEERQVSGAELTEFEKGVIRGANALRDEDEILAWTLTNRQMQDYLETIPYAPGVTMWQKFVEAVRTFLGLPASANTALSEVLRISDNLLNVPIGELGITQRSPSSAAAGKPGVRPGEQGTLFQRTSSESVTSRQATAVTEESSTPEDTGKIRQFLGNAKKSLRPFLLGSLSLSQIADVYGRGNTEVSAYNRLVQDMKADFIHITNQADPLIRKWDKLDKTASGRMAAIMEDARVTKYDPDTAASDPPVTQKERDLVAEFKLLPDDAKALYREVRGFYKTLMNDRFQAIIQRIKRTEASEKEKRDAVDEVSEIQKLLNEKVYFPLMRFGNYVVIAKKMVDGKEDMQQREVQTFESAAEAQRQAVLIRARGFVVKQTTVKEYNPDSDGAASAITQRLLDVIEKLPGTDDYVGKINTKKDLKDAINQLALQSLPDMSYAKHFIHAKDVKGASVDALRAFAHSALHGAHHISRIRHSDQLSRIIRKMDSRIEKTEGDVDVTESRQVHNELVQRHEMIINPNTDPFAAFLGQVGFTMSLGGVVATGVTNMTQTPLITLPFISARYGFAKSSTALTKAYNDFFTFSTLNRDSLFDASKNMKLPQRERDMLVELQRRGKIDLTQTMDISGRAAQDNLSRVARNVGTKRERIMQMLGFTFHAPEVMNRQVTALATYRLEVAKGSSYKRAVDVAAKVVDDTHYIYTQEERARYMSGNVLRVLTMFKQYGQRVAFMYGKAAHTWLAANDATPTERKEAKKQVLLMFGFQLGAAGYLGVPFMGSVASILTALMNGFGDDDEKKDWETELRKIVSDNLVETFGEETGKWAAEIAAHGLSRATPWDLAGRLGQQDLFIRPPKMEREGRAAAWDWMTSLMGPVAGYGVNAWLGVEDLAKAARDGDAGHFLRGTEELMPAVLRHAVKAMRYEVEGGVRTRDQHLQLETTWYEELGQIFGFAPTRSAEMYEGVTAIRQKEHRIETYRSSLLDRFAAAVESGDDGEQEKVLEKIAAFNERTPILHISGDTLRRSLRGRAVHEATMEGGISLPRTRQPLRDEGRFANY
jgi:hypothetical protein